MCPAVMTSTLQTPGSERRMSFGVRAAKPGDSVIVLTLTAPASLVTELSRNCPGSTVGRMSSGTRVSDMTCRR
jgi:hypothetical protein